MTVFDNCVVEMAVECCLHLCHVFQLRNIAHGDLLLAIAWAHWSRRHCLQQQWRAAGQEEIGSNPERTAAEVEPCQLTYIERG